MKALAIAEIARAASTLPLTIDNMQALIVIAERFAIAMQAEGGVTGADEVRTRLLDAFMACDELQVVDYETRVEWAREAA